MTRCHLLTREKLEVHVQIVAVYIHVCFNAITSSFYLHKHFCELVIIIVKKSVLTLCVKLLPIF